MPARLAIDFGTSNTVLAKWDTGSNTVETLHLKPFTMLFRQDAEQIPLIPSVIHYTKDNQILIGDQVFKQQLEDRPQTFVKLKTDILNRYGHKEAVNDKHLFPQQIAAQMVATILNTAIKELKISKNDPIAFTTPVDAFEPYREWLTRRFEEYQLNIHTFDEPTAAAVSLGKKVVHNDVWMLFDFGAGTLDISIVKFKQNPKSPTGMSYHVLAKEGKDDFGGNNIDSWIYRAFLEKHNLAEDDQIIKENSRLLMRSCCRAKEQLTYKEEAKVLLQDLENNKTLSMPLTRNDFQKILISNGLYKIMYELVVAAQAKMKREGHNPNEIMGIFMVGGSSLIPSIKTKLEENFYKPGQVNLHRPLDAIARGGAALAAGAKLVDHIQHNYYFRYLDDPHQKTYKEKLIISAGTHYPSAKPSERHTFSATTYNQTEFKVLFYEESPPADYDSTPTLILKDNFYQEPEPDSTTDENGAHGICINESSPVILKTRRAIQKNHKALDIEFMIDENKHLVINTFKYDTPNSTKGAPDKANVKVIKLK